MPAAPAPIDTAVGRAISILTDAVGRAISILPDASIESATASNGPVLASRTPTALSDLLGAAILSTAILAAAIALVPADAA